MSRRFGRNQKRKLRGVAAEALAIAARAQDSYDNVRKRAASLESDLLDFTYEVEALLGDLRHTSLKPPDLEKSQSYHGRIELLQRSRRDRLTALAMRGASVMDEARRYSRLVLEDLRTTVEPDFVSNYVHLTVQHGGHGARYFLTDRALAAANPAVYDTMIATIARDLAHHLIRAKRVSRSTTAPSGAQLEK